MATPGFAVTVSLVDQATSKLDAINKRLAKAQAPAERFNKSMEKFGKLTGLDTVGKKLGSIARGAFEVAAKLGEVLTPLAAITGAASLTGLTALATEFGDMGTRLSLLGTRLGVTGTGLKTLENAGRLASVPVEALDSGLTSLRDTMVNIVGGRAPEAQVMLQTLGLSAKDAGRFAQDPIAAFPILADKIAKIKDPTLQAMVATTLFGGAAEQLLPLLRKGGAGIGNLSDQAKRYGVVTQEGIAAGAAFNTAQTELALAVEGLGTAIGTKLLPQITPLLGQLSDWTAKNHEWLASQISGKVGELITWLKGFDWKAVGSDIEGFATASSHVVDWIVKWRREIEGVFLYYEGVRFTFALARIWLMAAAWAGVGTAATGAAAAQAAAVAAAGGVPAAATGLFAKLTATMGGIAGFLLRWSPLAAGLGVFFKGGDLGANKGEDELLKQLRDSGQLGAPAAGGASASAGPMPLDNLIDRMGLRGGGATPQGVAGLQSSHLDTATQHANELESFKYWQAHGMSDFQSAGMVAQERAESGFDPANVGDNGNARGSFQWHADRRANILAGTGIDVASDPNHLRQLQAMDWERRNSEKAAGDAIRQTRTAFEAGAAGSILLERPGDQMGQAQARGAWSRDNLGRLNAEAAAPAAAGPPVTVGGGTGGQTNSEAGVNGKVAVTVTHVNPPAGSRITSSTSGPGMLPAKIETSLPALTGT